MVMCSAGIKAAAPGKREHFKPGSRLPPTDCICPTFYTAIFMPQKTKDAEWESGQLKVWAIQGLAYRSLNWKL